MNPPQPPKRSFQSGLDVDKIKKQRSNQQRLAARKKRSALIERSFANAPSSSLNADPCQMDVDKAPLMALMNLMPATAPIPPAQSNLNVQSSPSVSAPSADAPPAPPVPLPATPHEFIGSGPPPGMLPVFI